MTKHIYTAIISTCLSLFGSSTYGQSPQAKEQIRKGNELYKNRDFSKAFDAYARAAHHDSSYAKALFNMGDALYQKGDMQEAAELFDQSAQLFDDDKDKARSLYNKGNASLQQAQSAITENTQVGESRKHLNQSIESYKHALRLDPNDGDARYNLSFSKQLLSQLPPDNEEEKEEEPPEEKEDEKPEDEKQDEEEAKEDEDAEEEKEESDNEENQDEDGDQDGEQEQGDQGEEKEHQEGQDG